MKAVFFNSIRLVKCFLPFYLLTFLPLHAQVGTWENYLAYHELQNICATWENYLAYHELQNICAASNNQLFVLASNSLYQYNQNDESITTYDKVTGLNDTYITHIAWNPKVQKLIAVYQNSNIDLIES